MLGRNLLGGIIVSFMFLAPASPSSVVTLYVNGETGKDSNNGTARDAPLKTILQAKEIVRSYLKSNASLPVDVRIAPGVYPVAAPLVFAGADSGASPAARVAYLPDLDASEQHRPRPAPVVSSIAEFSSREGDASHSLSTIAMEISSQGSQNYHGSERRGQGRASAGSIHVARVDVHVPGEPPQQARGLRGARGGVDGPAGGRVRGGKPEADAARGADDQAAGAA